MNITVSVVSLTGTVDLYVSKCKLHDCRAIKQEQVNDSKYRFLYRNKENTHGV